MKSKLFWGIAGILTLTFLLILTNAQTAPLVPQRGVDVHSQLIILVNEARADNGLPPLKRNEQLVTAADGHSQNMAVRNFLAHCDLDTRTSPSDRMVMAGYMPNNWAENIGAGFTSANTAFAWWRDSPVHWANILRADVRDIGVGYAYQADDQSGVRLDNNGDCVTDGATPFTPYHYWTLKFGVQNDSFPVVIEREATIVTNRVVDLYAYGAGWAASYRLRNEDGAWSAWQPFVSDIVWQLSAGTGDKMVTIELRNGDEIRSASDTIYLKDGDPPTATMTPQIVLTQTVTPQFDYLPALFNQFEPTQLPTATMTPTQLPTATLTPTSTVTITPTQTVTATVTPTPTPTVVPEPIASLPIAWVAFSESGVVWFKRRV